MKHERNIIPSLEQLSEMYDLLQKKPEKTQLDDWVWAGIWSRFDPRLAEIWVHTFAKSWQAVSPLPLKQKILQSKWPALFGVLLEFVNELVEQQKENNGQHDWHYYFKLLTDHIPPAPHEQFFFGTRIPGSKAQLDDTCFSLNEYKKWGYFSREILIHAKAQKNKFDTTRIDAETRKVRLAEWLKTQKQFTVQDYINLFQGHVSRRQAQRDLSEAKKTVKKLKVRGNTKGRIYQV